MNNNHNLPPVTENLKRRVARLKTLKGSKLIMINSILIGCWLVLLYYAVYQPLAADNRYLQVSDSIDSSVLMLDNDPASDMSVVEPNIPLITEETETVNDSATIKLMPFASQLPMYGENYFIDFPSDNGELYIRINSETAKTSALNWLKANNANTDELDIIWIN